MNLFISVLVLCAFSKGALGMEDAFEDTPASPQTASTSPKTFSSPSYKPFRLSIEERGPQEQIVLSWNKSPYYHKKVKEAFKSVIEKGRNVKDFSGLLQEDDIQNALKIFGKSAYGNIILALSDFYGDDKDIRAFCNQLVEDLNLPALLAITPKESLAQKKRPRNALSLDAIEQEEQKARDTELDAIINKCEQRLYASYVFQALRDVYKKGMLMQGMTILLGGDAVQAMIHHVKFEDRKDVILSLVGVYEISPNMEEFAERVMKSEAAKDLIYNHQGAELKEAIVAMSELDESTFNVVIHEALDLIYRFQEGVSIAARAVRTVAKVFDIHKDLMGVAFGYLKRDIPLEDDEYFGEEEVEDVFAIFERFYNAPDAA